MTTQRRRTTAGVTAAVLALTLAATACSGDDDDDDPGRSGPSTAFDEEFSVLGALAEVPDDAVGDGQLVVQAADLRAASDLAGIDMPTDGSREGTSEWLTGLTANAKAPVFVPLGDLFNTQAASPDEFAEVAGWSVLDVNSFVEYAVPPKSFMVVSGDFDADTLADDLVDVDDGIVSDLEGEDLALDIERATALNRLGTPTRLAQQGHRIAVSTSTPAVQEWLDGDASLADQESFAAVAAALDDEDVVSAVLAQPTSGDPAGTVLGDNVTPEQLKALQEQLEGELPKDPFDAVGIGWGVDDGRSEVHVAYHFASSSAAEAGADVLEDAYRDGTSLQARIPWSDRMSVEDVETEGSVVTVTVTPTDAGSVNDLYNALVQRDGLFISP